MKIKNQLIWTFLAITSIYCLSFTKSFAQVTLITEDFSSGSGTTPPTGWSNVQDSGEPGELWDFDNPNSIAIGIPTVGDVAIFDSDFYGSVGANEDVSLVSPAFDASSYATVTLLFDHYFREGFGGAYSVDVYDGSSWNTVLSGTTSTTNATAESIDITIAADGDVNAQVRFRWTGDWSWYWAVDNVRVVGTLPVTDTDGDGVADTNDLDDDNDGISDINEGTSCDINYSLTGDIDGDRDRGASNNDLNRDFVFGDDYFFNLTFPAATAVVIETTIGDATNSRTGTVTVDGVDEAISTSANAFQTVSHSPSLSASYSVNIVGYDMTVTTIVVYDLAANVLAAFDFGRSGSPLYPGYVPIHSGTTTGVISYNCGLTVDTDGDGILDMLDLDSDNDGCYDTDEQDISDSDNDGIAGTGVPTVDVNGLVTSITYATPLNTFWRDSGFVGDACDTDGDNIQPSLDLDDDNDGILDVIEQECGVLPPGGIASPTEVLGGTSVTTIYTNFGDFWESSVGAISGTLPNTSHELLAFTTGGITYTTGVPDDDLYDTDSNGLYELIDTDNDGSGDLAATEMEWEAFSNLNEITNKLSLEGDLNDGDPTNALGLTILDPATESLNPLLTNGVQGLDLGTGIANINESWYYSVDIISASAVGDGVPDLLITQVAQPSFTAFQTITFYGPGWVPMGNAVRVESIGTGPLSFQVASYELDIYNGAGGVWGANTTRPIRMAALELSEFGIAPADVGQVVSMKIELASSADVAFVGYNTSTFAGLCSDVDADNDGIPNRLDLDSDNDGIWDLVEAGHGEATTNGRLTGPVGANGLDDDLETAVESGLLNYSLSDTDSDGTNDVLDLDSDDDNCNDTDEENINDGDHDGIAGSGVPSVDTDGLVTSITYTNPTLDNWQDNSKLGDHCVDTDTDGIVNGIDLDDDNDGILDRDECVIDNVLIPMADGLADNNFPRGYWDAEVFEGAYGIAGSTFGGTSSDFDENGSSGSPIFHGEAFYGVNDTDFNFAQTWTAAENPTNPAIPNYVGGTYSGGSHYSIHFNRTMDLDGTLDFGGPASFLTGDDVVEVLINGTQVYFGANCCGAPTQPQTTPASISYAAGDEVQIKFVNIGGAGGLSANFEANYSCDEDFDGDGVINSFDLDSDNDGIWDAAEAGHSETITSGRITGTMGANGFDNAVETFAESGLADYTPSDSDGDGILDIVELDSDDDGCYDTSEEAISDSDDDGIAGTGTPTVDANGLVTSIVYGAPSNSYWQDYTFVADDCDTDGDNVNPLVDLDDDNDGILDDDENRVCDGGSYVWIANWTMNGGSGTSATYVDSDATAGDFIPAGGWDSWSIPGSALSLSSTNFPQSLAEAISGDFYVEHNIVPGAGKAFEIDQIVWGFNDYVNTPKNDFKVAVYTNKDNYTTPLLVDISRSNDVDNYIWQSNPIDNVLLKDIADSLVFRFYVYEPTVGIGGAAIINGTITFDDVFLGGYHMVLDDCDNDGIANIYDLDADGDGCFDAIEGAMDFNPSHVDGNGALTGGVDLNGVPLVALGGQANTTEVVDENDNSQCPCTSVFINQARAFRMNRE